ncbi:MAG: NAD(P)-dependent oxidoreductase [Gemmatimonadota bacterium]|nr:NAD(P)-dependent oxidoreductase [Gemmatimonadota bacterium]
MRVFVAGATGVLGRRVVPALLAQGHAVTGIGRASERLSALASKGMTPAAIDLFDAPKIKQAMLGHDVVINVATRVPPPSRMFLPGAWKEMDHVRREGSALLADAAISAGVARFIQESFALIYPDSGDAWINEAVPPKAARYNRSTLDAEASAARVARTGATAVVLRFALLYGPGDAFAEQIVGSIRRGWAPFFGRREGFVSLVTQEDAAAAAAAALTVPSGTYNVVDDAPMRRDAITEHVARLLNVKPPKFLPPWMAKLGGSLGETLSRSLRISNERLKQASEWVPATPSAHEGLERAIGADRAPSMKSA